jgi:hypothetical protein
MLIRRFHVHWGYLFANRFSVALLVSFMMLLLRFSFNCRRA